MWGKLHKVGRRKLLMLHKKASLTMNNNHVHKTFFPSISAGAIIGAFILPHGAITLEPSRLIDYDNENNPKPKDPSIDPDLCLNLHNGLQTVSDQIVNQLKPDLIVLFTPHGICCDDEWSIYLNSFAKGSAEWNGEYSQFCIDNPKLEMPTQFSIQCMNYINQLQTQLKKSQKNYNYSSNNKKNKIINGIWNYTNGAPTLLQWGEVIPLYFIHKRYKQLKIDNSQSTNESIQSITENENEKEKENKNINEDRMPPVMIMTPPRQHRQYKVSYQEMLDRIELIGSRLTDFFHNKGNIFDHEYKRILILISGDLAHTHQNKPYGYSKTASPFDQLINEWAISGDEKMLDDASQIVSQAGACGWLGFLLLNQILKRLETKYFCTIDRKNIVDACHPSYYGMMISAFGSTCES